MSLVLLFCLLELQLAYKYLQYKKNKFNKEVTPAIKSEDLPFVTIQLPVYNEQYVVERLIDACMHFDYPKEKFEIQVLDDSNDETLAIVKNKVNYWQAKGFQIEQVTRNNRTGYKAGALQYGLAFAKGEFIAIFDADFLPPKNFLQVTIPYFQTPNIGVVQTRWAHLNKNYSLLTKVQAFMLDVHFAIEHTGRNQSGLYMNFNGTAGVWRKQAIVDAGGWSADTITEDLDLSYRAQLAGWKFKYLYKVETPAELPVELNGYKSQQYRWNKGGAEVAIKLLPNILGRKLHFNIKLNAIHHLLSSSLYIVLFLVLLISMAITFFYNDYPHWLFNFGAIFFVGFIAIGIVYYLGYRSGEPKKINSVQFLFLFMSFISVSMGMTLHNAKAVLSAYLGRKSPFVRTAKYNISNKKEKWQKKQYVHNLDAVVVGEALMVLGLIYVIFNSINNQFWGFLPLHLVAFFGYSFVLFYSIKHHFAIKKN